MISKFYVIDGDNTIEDKAVFVNTPLEGVLEQLDDGSHWLYVKPVGETGLAVADRQTFVEYMRSLRSRGEGLEVVAYLHKAGRILDELDEILG